MKRNLDVNIYFTSSCSELRWSRSKRDDGPEEIACADTDASARWCWLAHAHAAYSLQELL